MNKNKTSIITIALLINDDPINNVKGNNVIKNIKKDFGSNL